MTSVTCRDNDSFRDLIGQSWDEGSILISCLIARVAQSVLSCVTASAYATISALWSGNKEAASASFVVAKVQNHDNISSVNCGTVPQKRRPIWYAVTH